MIKSFLFLFELCHTHWRCGRGFWRHSVGCHLYFIPFLLEPFFLLPPTAFLHESIQFCVSVTFFFQLVCVFGLIPFQLCILPFNGQLPRLVLDPFLLLMSSLPPDGALGALFYGFFCANPENFYIFHLFKQAEVVSQIQA